MGRASSAGGPYVLRPLLDSVPLSADGSANDIKINCVDYYDGNLYIGTSASELLHFVQVPPDPTDISSKPLFILASRLSPAFSDQIGTSIASQPGVQQVLLLPAVGKACVLCNSTVTFYSLPELSPVFGTTQVKNCNWIGGLDLNLSQTVNPGEASSGVTILLSLSRRIQVVRISTDARVFKKIDFAASILSSRRDSIACVADSTSYALLDVDRQLKIPLMRISPTLDKSAATESVGQVQSLSADSDYAIARSASFAQRRSPSLIQPHGRSASLGGSILEGIRHPERRHSEEDEPVFQQPSPPPMSSNRDQQHSDSDSTTPRTGNPMHSTSEGILSTKEVINTKNQPPALLKPHIASPTSDEFLLVIGTNPWEAGIGMFVNLDGDATRPTIEFERYPEEIAVDDLSAATGSSQYSPPEKQGFVLASIMRKLDGRAYYGIEIQHLDAGNQASPEKHWLSADDESPEPYGIRSLTGSGEIIFEEIVDRLIHCRFSPLPVLSAFDDTVPYSNPSGKRPSNSSSLLGQAAVVSEPLNQEKKGHETNKNLEGEHFVRGLANTESRLVAWSGNCIWWAVRSPLLLQLDAILEAASQEASAGDTTKCRHAIFQALGKIRERDARTELEFMTVDYLRQKAGLLLLSTFLRSPESPTFTFDDVKAISDVLVGSKLDARIVLCLVSGLEDEVVEGPRGIWIYGGVKTVADWVRQNSSSGGPGNEPAGKPGLMTMHFLRRFLSSWRKMKGFGSIPDEQEVFRTVDAALLKTLLELAQRTAASQSDHDSVMAELNEVVDRGVDCFDRAVELLESHHRLFILSRLYQSRKMAGDVLATWKRILEGERDDGPEFRDGERRVREYLAKINSQGLVREYGTWLAQRNPKLGAQVFADDKARAPKMEPRQAMEILRQEAPRAIRYYLEHLVFDKEQWIYANDLINYYLDIVLGDLASSAESREVLAMAYDAYRALRAPKPTYENFLSENTADDDELWQSRLRLLQLLGGDHNYDWAAIRARLTGFPGELLVPETITLAGREGQHEEALRLLVHRLGDYDTAIRYCLRGRLGVYAQPAPVGGGGSGQAIEEQRRLFHVVLVEFLAISDISDRVEQTGGLLERFGGWFDVEDVLGLVPDDWSVDVVADFLVGALRRLMRERHEMMMTRALSGAENLRVNHDLILVLDEKGPAIETESKGASASEGGVEAEE